MTSDTITARSVSDCTRAIRPERKIDSITAVLLPYTNDGSVHWDGFAAHLQRTVDAGLQPSINMDTGFGPQQDPAQRREVLAFVRKQIGDRPFVAGAQAFKAPGDPTAAYRSSVQDILAVGATPIVFQHPCITDANREDLVAWYRSVLDGCEQALAFELGTMFAPFGRIYDLDTYAALMDIPQLLGAKHSSLSRELEWQRLDLRDRHRPDWKVYTGNDLAIDLVMYGSDYLLGLSTFDPHAFAQRDAWWQAGDPRFYELNDALQALGAVAFRAPVPAYKHSAAIYLAMTGQMPADVQVHPECPLRPDWEQELLQPLADQIAIALNR